MSKLLSSIEWGQPTIEEPGVKAVSKDLMWFELSARVWRSLRSRTDLDLINQSFKHGT